ncbi:hypothetical protein CASFOL_006131 [Castilleja foliolosa]|uniref:Transposase MuDR plant domain-containing protein n=1 Tax=Castilleja foliolosa TaxID=1961234 RepID=A0ABD3E5U7_9LAMI
MANPSSSSFQLYISKKLGVVLRYQNIPVDQTSSRTAVASMNSTPNLNSAISETRMKLGDCDDSSDEDYILPEDDDNDVSIESDAPSEELEDIEGSSEDDIFMEKTFTKKDQLNKLKKMLNKSVRSNPRLKECRIDKSTPGWYSDVEDEDSIENLDHCSEIETRGCPMYIEGQGMKNMDLEVCMKFPNVDVYREALKDWVIRNGYELKYLKNERKRITAKCNAEGCNWRIHASIVQGGPLFQLHRNGPQVKTISGEHNCAKKRVNKHANAKYIGKRLAESINDNPDVSIMKLQSSIMRKVGVEAGYWKAVRAKRAALEKVRGQDEAEYKLLWDYRALVQKQDSRTDRKDIPEGYF